MNRFGKNGSQTPDVRARENQTKFIQEAVNKVEKNFGLLCTQMGSVNRKNSRLRDKFDEMAKTLINYANIEPGSLKVGITQFAEHLSAVQDYRQALIDRMDAKVVQPFSAYKTACKHTKTDLSTTMKSRGREVKQHKQLESLRNRAPSDRHSITRAETELQRATVDVERSTKVLEETIDKFEAKRVADIKKILIDFVQVEMLFHAKALERYTACFEDLKKIDVEEHLVLFRNTLRPSSVQQRMDAVRQTGGTDNNNSQLGEDPYSRPQGRTTDTPSSLMHSTDIADSNDQERQRIGDWEEDEGDEEDDYDDDDEYTEDEEDEEYDSQQPAAQQQRLKPW